MASHEYMDCALSLAGLAMGYTRPNPAVGAAVIKDGIWVGMGYTQPAGSAHAEVVALRQAGDRARGATMYVTLEPCSHHGRTPPCTEAIIEAGISQVYVALRDPNPLISGRGIDRLNEAGIRTHVGTCERKAHHINEAYIKHITTGLPFVIAKFAMSLDGKIATRTGQSKWITGPDARRYAHALRYIVDAVMVGVNTVIADNPRLTARGCGGRGGTGRVQPLRLIVDSKGRVPLNARVFEPPGNVLLVVAEPLAPAKKERLTAVGAEVMEVPDSRGAVDVVALLKLLGQRQIGSVLVEGGGALLGSLFDRRLVDKVQVFMSPVIIGGGRATTVAGRGIDKMAEALRLKRTAVKSLGDDVLVTGYVDEDLPREDGTTAGATPCSPE